MKRIDISIILPLYKPRLNWQGRFMENISLVKKIFPSTVTIEFIVVNDGFETPELLTMFDSAIRSNIVSNSGVSKPSFTTINSIVTVDGNIFLTREMFSMKRPCQFSLGLYKGRIILMSMRFMRSI